MWNLWGACGSSLLMLLLLSGRLLVRFPFWDFFYCSVSGSGQCSLVVVCVCVCVCECV